jgi:hypothetical protein
MIRFVCECGKQLQARDEHAGLMVLCPSCQRQQQVPQAPPPAVQPVEAIEPAAARGGVRRSPPPIRDEPEVEDDRPRRRPPVGNSGKAIASLILGIVSLVCGCSCVAGLPSILLGMLSLKDIGQAAGRMTGKPMAIIGIVLGCLSTLCWPPAYWFIGSRFGDAQDRIASQNNLKQMGIAMFNFNDTYSALPLPGGDLSKPPGRQPQSSLLSWRVAILPFIEESRLYNQFKLDEPWDSPHNKPLLAKMPKVYRLPGDNKTPPDQTHYQVFVGNGAAFDSKIPSRIPISFADGTSNTILIAIVDQAVPWTKPDDVAFDPNRPVRPLLSTYHNGAYLVLLADGSVRSLSRDISEKTLKMAITANDGQVMGPDW